MRAHDILGYSHSTRFYAPDRVDDLPANELAFTLRVASIKCAKIGATPRIAAVKFEGAYVLQQESNSPAVPVVYLVRVESETLAREVHEFVWNQNQAPFLIIESPSTIRVYPGFSYDRDGDRTLISVAKDAADLLEKLSAFRGKSIDDGTLWSQWAHAVDPLKRVDESLLRDLKRLDDRLQSQGVVRTASHGLIGKFVYLRYLHDRGILSPKKLKKWGIDPDHLFTRQATLEAFGKVNDELQTWLNGSVFSLGEEELKDITEPQLQLVAGVFHGDSPVGSEDVQPTLFDSYDFSHIPIETLSCVYEQFLHDAKVSTGISRGRTLGAYYTPLPLAEYVLSELNSRKRLKPGMKVLDPACGSGAFLVQCYRRLIETSRRIEGRDLKKSTLRDLLTKYIFGVDRDGDACRVAELSLIMTLLDYVQPPDLEDTSFKLPLLRNENIFQGDFFDETGPVSELLKKERFDWVVGNPPWAEVKKTPPPDHEHAAVHQWMLQHKKSHPTAGNQIAEAFLWKTGEHLAPDGICGLVVLAMTWFKKEGTKFRKQFFSVRRVWKIANFSNLAYVLFAGRSERPAAVVFFESGPADEEHLIESFAPFVAEQVSNRPKQVSKRQVTWNIVSSGNDIRKIENSVAKLGDSLIWKLAMWGTSRDRKLLQRLDARFKDEKFDSLSRFGIGEPHQGLELRPETAKEELEPHPELEGKTKLFFQELRNLRHFFAFPETALGTITSAECFVRKGRAVLPIAVSTPPHIVVDASRRFAVFSDEFLAIPSRQIGISGTAQSEIILRALSLYLSSEFVRYHQFFHAPKWGIDESIADLNTLKVLPVPITLFSSSGELGDWAKFQVELAGLSKRQFGNFGFTPDEHSRFLLLISEFNNRVYKLLGLKPAERWLVEDFVNFHIELNKGKLTKTSMRPSDPDEQHQYLVALRDCLDGFLSTDRGLHHKLDCLPDRDSALFSVSLVKSKVAIVPSIQSADEPASRNLKTIRENLRSAHSQWIYFDRALKIYERGVLYQFKPMQRLHWTRRQAVLDADDIIAETLVKGSPK